ncbi:hypothetical protein J3Q64DRAFT_1699664 [Phycomyces blakesleeanus]|uniref:F-box domain-containing protein n=2 Tax=Phycomyces blakesleeanus TaxID=4837 RepID=A0A162PRY5_PHYB8|nr:hypothetical protein PHYBLDRAFT_169484 [Phycomyces blakesleeanus NRRL 1555(-)]OAD72346.1 hypothetical protein PHYBLDRAFT_169484 [Phycomyces blakesleeanus NRRL 1555(-)]|eukprot:XP_018290386.1 hypothetical protein PHYBLDRAFT_169484 [Phycomyces blakesleeanus NRRL 1555(-)]
MLLSELPFEILSKIASELSRGIVSQCCLVCKAFLEPFQESLWRDIRICNQDDLDIICCPETPKAYSKFGHKVHNLCLITHGTMTDHQLKYLQNLFPHVKSLYIHGVNAGPFDDIALTGLGPWYSVKNLDITFLGDSTTAIKQVYLALLPLFPNVIDLKLNCRFQAGVAFYVEDFEIIHACLPQLKHLLTSVRLGMMTTRDLLRVPEVPPAKSMLRFDAGLEDIDHRWLCYFAQKYPNLQAIRWVIDEEYESDEEVYNEMDIVPQETNNDYGESIVRFHDRYHSIGEDGFYHRLNRGVLYNKEEALDMFSRLPRVFPHLETTDFYSTGETDIIGPLIWKIFTVFKVPVKNIHYFFGHYLEEEKLLHNTIHNFTLAFSQTIEELFIDSVLYFNSRQEITASFERCPHLTQLEINKCNVSIDVDILMDRCISLKKIKIAGGLITVSSDTVENPPSHGLRLLDLKEIILVPGALDHISKRCKRLNYMALENVQIFGQVEAEGGLSIDMSLTHFKLIYIYNVNFSSSFEFIELRPKDIGITIVSTPHYNIKWNDKPGQMYNKYKKYDTEVSQDHTEECTDSKGPNSSKLLILDKEDSQNAYVYFHKLKTVNKTHESDLIQECYKKKSDITPKKSENLSYAIMKCGKIDAYEIRVFGEGKNVDYWKDCFNTFGTACSRNDMSSIFDFRV